METRHSKFEQIYSEIPRSWQFVRVHGTRSTGQLEELWKMDEWRSSFI